MTTAATHPSVFDQAASEIRAAAWELALAVVQEGLAEEAVPSLTRLDRHAQLGSMPTFIAELGREVADPHPAQIRPGSPLATVAHEHAREREELGFAPREVITELLLLRRVLWRFLARREGGYEPTDVLQIERRVDDTIDMLVAECVVAYFDRATLELAERARCDPLTGLLNHQAFTRELESELERAQRYGGRLSLVFFDLDSFKQINDTLGHLEGDRALRGVAAVLAETMRGSDLAGRMGGDEFAVCLLEGDDASARAFVGRLEAGIEATAQTGAVPPGLALSAGIAHAPSEATAAEALFSLADERLYEVKRSRKS